MTPRWKSCFHFHFSFWWAKIRVYCKPGIQGTPSPIWVTNGMVNSACNLLCALIKSRLEGFHWPFQTVAYLSLLTFLRSQRRLTLPLLYRWENWDLHKVKHLTKVTLRANMVSDLMLPATDTPRSHTGEFCPGLFSSWPRTFIKFHLCYSSVHAKQYLGWTN